MALVNLNEAAIECLSRESKRQLLMTASKGPEGERTLIAIAVVYGCVAEAIVDQETGTAMAAFPGECLAWLMQLRDQVKESLRQTDKTSENDLEQSGREAFLLCTLDRVVVAQDGGPS
jgi:hypothetical protein